MRKKLFRHFQFSMFRGLFLSLLGVALLTCGAVSLIILNQSVKNMREENEKLLESKLYTVITDLENQMDSMMEAMADMSYRQEFKWNSIKKSKYNEITAMAQMKSYVKSNNIWGMCFIKYPGYDNIMTSGANVTPIEVYLSNLYGGEKAQEVQVILNKLYMLREKICVAFSDGKTTLFLLPTVRHSENSLNRMVIGFEVTSNSIEKRIRELTGGLAGDIQIRYNEKIIYGGEFPEEKGQVLEYTSYDSGFQICYRMTEHDYFSWKPIFTFKNIIGFVIIGLLIMGLVFVLTFWNYRPVRKLATKYIPTQDGEIQPALASIDLLIENLLKNKEKDSKILQEQYKALQEQVAYMIISGYSGEALKNHLTLLNIDYENSMFGVISCDILENAEVPDMGMLTTAIGDLTGEVILLYPCYHKDMGLKVLVVVEEVYQFNEALEMMNSLFETMKLNIALRISDRSSDLENWWHLTEEQSREAITPVRINDKQKSVVGQVVEYMQQHYAEYDLSLEYVASQFTTHPSYLSRIIKQELGIGYKEYLMELRMNKAKELLLDPNVSVANVCVMIGYTNTSHFIKLFQKYTGMTPAKYRDEYNKEKQENKNSEE